jgi:short-subunit dehydrogenase
LITGASAGIGAAFARVFAEHGHELVLAARREAQLATLADAIAASGRRRPHVLTIDLAGADACDRIADDLAARGLEPAIVVNSAGFGLRGPASELDRGLQLAMIDLNIRVLTDLSLRWIDAMGRHGGGILNVGSLASFYSGPGMAVYFACKAYGLAFSEALHHELAPAGIKVTIVCPGPVPTEFHALAGVDEHRLPQRLVRSAERVAREAHAGFMRGQRLVIPGFANKVAAALPRFLTRSLMLAMAESQQLKIGGAQPRIS